MTGEPGPPDAEGRRALRAAFDSATPIPLKALQPTPHEDAAGMLPQGCPVTPLGVLGETRYYLDFHQQLVALHSGEHVRLRLNGLFGLESEYPESVDRWTRKDAKGGVAGVKWDQLAKDFFAACAAAGVWDPAQNERSRGAWLGEDGALILHLGDSILQIPATPDGWRHRRMDRPGLIGRVVYPAGEPTPPPAEKSAGSRPGEDLLAMLETWHWRRGDLDAVFMVGWIGAAMLGGALEWRPAVWLSGGKGTGKSTLQKLLQGLFGNGLLSLTDTSPAGIWQELGNQSLCVAVDELEAGEDNRKQLATVQLARISASGGIMSRGTDKHKAKQFTLRSCFAFSSVLVPPLDGPDRSRIALLELDELAADQIRPAMNPHRLRLLGQQLRRAMVDGWHRFPATLEHYKAALKDAGHQNRAQDQYGTLLACADLLLFGPETDADAGADWVARMHASEFSETADDTRDEDQCLQHMLSCPLDAYRRGDRVTMGEWINRAAGQMPGWDDPREAARILSGYGVRIEGKGDERTVAIAATHSGLATLFERTKWQTPRGTTGVWTQSLRRLSGAERLAKPLYFGGSISRATLIPLRLIPQPDNATSTTQHSPE